MPELPEVETIASMLRSGGSHQHMICGCRVHQAQVFWARSLANLTVPQFCNRITGQAIEDVRRRGKFVVLTLTHDTLLIHLRMSGDLRVESAVNQNGIDNEILKHDRLLLDFDCGQRLVFNDTRKFGRVWLTDNPQEVLGSLGPEPLNNDLTGKVFHMMLGDHKRQLKPLLMDQSFLAGLGNIYTDEALYAARLHPQRISNSLTYEEAIHLLKAIRNVLNEGIRRNGASIDWVYRGGDFQNYFQVYGKTGQPCLSCGTPISRLVVGQRSTHICPHCQPAGNS